MRRSAIIQKQGFNVHYRPGTADEEVLKESFEHDLFFPGIPEYKIRPDHIIMDVGAHIGCFTLLAADKVRKGKVFSFEPSDESYQLLDTNVKANNFSNVVTYRAALAAKDGVTNLYHDTTTGNWGHTIVKAVSAEVETVKCINMETFIETEGLDRIDFIKFNCEGAEYGILIHTSVALLKRIKCMLILFHGYLEENYSKEQLAAYLSSAGFHIHYRFKNKGDDSGWMIAYRAGFTQNIFINLRTIPLKTSLAINKIKRKFRRAVQIIFKDK